MTKRANITIPDDLFSEYEKFKDKINLSGEAQRCLKMAIERQKRINSEVKNDMEKAIERLKAEKAELKSNYTEQAVKDGIYWAKNQAGYNDLVYTVNWDARKFPPDFQDSYEGEALVDHLEQYLETFNHPEINLDVDPDAASLASIVDWKYDLTAKVLEAWHSGVVEFWEQVQDKLDD